MIDDALLSIKVSRSTQHKREIAHSECCTRYANFCGSAKEKGSSF